VTPDLVPPHICYTLRSLCRWMHVGYLLLPPFFLGGLRAGALDSTRLDPTFHCPALSSFKLRVPFALFISLPNRFHALVSVAQAHRPACNCHQKRSAIPPPTTTPTAKHLAGRQASHIPSRHSRPTPSRPRRPPQPHRSPRPHRQRPARTHPRWRAQRRGPHVARLDAARSATCPA